MPSSAAANRPEDLTAALGGAASASGDVLLRNLKEMKNQIIGNRTKKLRYLGLGAVPRVVAVLAAAETSGDDALLIQAAAALGSFACGVDDGARAVFEAGAVHYLTRLLDHPVDKVVNAGARTLRMIFQSKLTPKYEILEGKNMQFLISLLVSDNDIVTELSASIIAHSCVTVAEQKALCDAGVLERLASLLEGSINQRDLSLDSITAIVRNNSEVATKFTCIAGGKALNCIVGLTKDRNPRTRLLACTCLIAIRHASPFYIRDLRIKADMIQVLVELLEEDGRVGDDAPFALSNLISSEKELHNHAASINAVEKLCNFMLSSSIPAKRLEGIFLALSELCSMSESCRGHLMSLQVLNIIADALKHDCTDVRLAACTCLRNLSRSVKNLSAGNLCNETVVVALVQLLQDPSISVQVAALGAMCNIAVDFKAQKSTFFHCGGVKQLVELAKSMDCSLRLKAVWALRNLLFLADPILKELVIQELTVYTLASLICDSDPLIQEQALALISNLIDGCAESIKHVFAEDGIVMNAASRQLQSASSQEVCIQGMLLLSNIAAGDECHKEVVMALIILSMRDGTPFIVKFLQSKSNLLRTAAVWCVINLTYRDSPSSSSRIEQLRDAGIISQIKMMTNDPCLDTKFRVRTALEQCTVLESS